MPCQNTVCPAEWTAFDLAKKEAVDANLKNWFGEEITNTRICKTSAIRMQHIDWSATLQSLAQQRSFVQLRQYINSNPIPDLICHANDKLMQEETVNIDLVAMHYMPTDMPSALAPVQIEGDGNCLPRQLAIYCQNHRRCTWKSECVLSMKL